MSRLHKRAGPGAVIALSSGIVVCALIVFTRPQADLPRADDSRVVLSYKGLVTNQAEVSKAASASSTRADSLPQKRSKTVRIARCNGIASHDTDLIHKAGTEAGAGGRVEFGDAQRCTVHTLTLMPSVSYISQQGKRPAILRGASDTSELKLSHSTRLIGLAFCNLTLNATNTENAVIGNSKLGSRGCEDTSINADGSSRLRIINNDLTSIAGTAILGYSPTELLIDGNHFNGCGADCIDFPEGTGSNSLIIRNIFLNTHLAVMEIGYTATAPTTNLRVINNWAAQSLAEEYAYKIAYSLPLNGEGSSGTLIRSNYADGKTSAGNGAICIELSGTGIVLHNTCRNFDFGAIGYGMSGRCEGLQVYSDNAFVGTVYGTVVSYLGCGSDVFQEHRTSTTTKKVPPKPERRPWP